MCGAEFKNSNHGPTYTGLPAVRFARETHLFREWAISGVYVWNGRLAESTASVHYLHRVLD